MGSILKAKCDCGFDKDLYIGCGMANGPGVQYFPCLCERCHSIKEINVLGSRMRCPRCKSSAVIPYDDPRLVGRAGQDAVVGFEDEEPGRILTNGTYKCPKCGNLALRFFESGCWD